MATINDEIVVAIASAETGAMETPRARTQPTRSEVFEQSGQGEHVGARKELVESVWFKWPHCRSHHETIVSGVEPDPLALP